MNERKERINKLAHFIAFNTWDVLTLKDVAKHYNYQCSEEGKLRVFAKKQLINDYTLFPAIFEDEWGTCFGEI